MLYYADRISDNIRIREPEGFLICVNVPIARTGTQQYFRDEIGQTGDGQVTVCRPEEEVFSSAAMTSFEGMPVTNDHPDAEEGVTVDNIQYLQKGHCQNVRRGTGAEKDLLIADLFITDQQTIQEILGGKREISCGYTYEICEEDGRFIQRQIRGNHIAIVDKGRAGHRVCIKDSTPKQERREPKMAKKNHNGILAKMLAALVARDAEPEEIEEAVDAIEALTSTTAPAEPQPVEEGAADSENPDILNQILDRLTRLEEALAARAADGEEDPAEGEEAPADAPAREPEEERDPLQELEDELAGEEEPEEPVAPDEDPEEPEAHFVDPDEINGEDEDDPVEEEEETIDCRARDAFREAIRAVRPIISELPPAERRKAADAMAAQLRKASGLDGKAVRNDYLRLKKARKKAADSQKDPTGLGRSIMEKRNPNYKK